MMKSSNENETTTRRTNWVGTILLGLGVYAGFLAVCLLDHEQSRASSIRGRHLQESVVEAITLDAFMESLPDYTKTSLADANSPQSIALDWLSTQHPEFETMSETRRLQLFALVTIYYSLDGPNWTRDAWWGPGDLSNWLNASHPECLWDERWESRSVCDANGELVTLNLDYIQTPSAASIAMPAEIGLLSNLRRISYLVDMEVSLEQLLPEPQHFELPLLSSMALTISSGTLSSAIGGLSALTSLSVYHKEDAITGSYGYGAMPSELGLLTNLREMTFLKTLGGGLLPTEMGLLTDMTRLSITGTYVTGPIPTQIGLMTSLLQLTILDNPVLQGPLPTELGALTKLNEVDIKGNEMLNGAIPSQLVALTDLFLLDLSYNQLSSTLPSEIGLAVDLRRVNLQGNQLISGPIPSQMGLLSQLYNLDLADNAFNETLPSELGLLADKMDQFNVSWNLLQGVLPSEIGLFDNIESFDLSHNMLEGPLPTEIGQMGPTVGRGAWMLDLSHNNINGALPSEMGIMSRMTSLYLDHNKLEGALPSEVGQLSYLQEFNIAFNSFDASLPTEIGLMAGMKYLNASNLALLTGPIPSEMGGMTNLLELDLSNNPGLTGAIPEQLGELVLTHDLHRMDVAGSNQLSGQVPAGLCELNNEQSQDTCEFRGGEGCSFTYDCGTLCGCDNCFCFGTVDVARYGDGFDTEP